MPQVHTLLPKRGGHSASSLVINTRNLGGIVMIRRAEGQSSVKVGAGLAAREILGPKPGSAADVWGGGLGRAGHFPYFGLSFLPLNKN